MLLLLLSILLFSCLALFIFIFLRSPGTVKPFVDSSGNKLKGSISEKTFITVGGVKQAMFIVGKDTSKPVLLYIHGGPAFPNYFLIDKFNPGLEDIFTVCYWEQRGGGLSFSPEVTLESMNFRQLSDDAIEVANYLRTRFNKNKIYMLAHSGGTPFAIMAVAREPQLFSAYIGMAQITRQAESEKIAYKYMFEQYGLAKNNKIVKELKKYPVLDSSGYIVPFYKSLIRDQAMHNLGIGTMRNMRSIFKDVFVPVWMCRAYTLNEKINIWKSKFSFLKKTKLINELFSINIPDTVKELAVPVYFFSGKFDRTVNHELSGEYLQQLKAPVKGFYTFSNSAHSPLYEEPDRLKKIIINDVLKGQVNLDDKEESK